MNCAEWEERIALYAGGDLRDGTVERHVAECPGCQVFASGMRQALDFLHTGSEEIAPAHYAAVRARVLAEVARPRRRWVLAWAAVAAVICAALGIGIRIEREMRVDALPMRAAAPPAAPVVHATVVAKAVVERHVAEKRVATARGEEVVVRVETDVPDVVIYWIADVQGDSR